MTGLVIQNPGRNLGLFTQYWVLTEMAKGIAEKYRQMLTWQGRRGEKTEFLYLRKKVHTAFNNYTVNYIVAHQK